MKFPVTTFKLSWTQHCYSMFGVYFVVWRIRSNLSPTHLTVAAACAVPSAFVIPPSLLLTVIMFIPGEAAPAALSAHRRRATLPHQALQLREHHWRRGQEIASHAATLPQPQVHTCTPTRSYTHLSTSPWCLSLFSVAPKGQALQLWY